MIGKQEPQRTLWEADMLLPPKKLAALKKTWAWSFRMEALPLIDAELFRPFYCEALGRPSKPVETVVSVLILKELFDLTDEEALYRLDFDLGWHVALMVGPEQAHCCQKTLHNFRARLMASDGGLALFQDIADKIVRRLSLSTKTMRMDSTHFSSNVALVSRLGLFCETMRLFLCAVRRLSEGKYEGISEGLRRRYADADGGAAHYADARSSDAPRRVGVCGRDVWRLLDHFRGDVEVASLPETRLLQRLFLEQCEVDPEAGPAEADASDADAPFAPVRVKRAKDLRSHVMQTPHDPTVTYSGHKGQGYEGQLAETCGNGDKPEVIVYAEPGLSCRSDVHRTMPTVENLAGRDLAPETLVADTTYGSTEHVIACAHLGTELVTPVSGPPPADPSAMTAGDFDIDVCGARATRCPAGHEALGETRDPATGVIETVFDSAQCVQCPHRNRCPARDKGDGRRVLKTTLNNAVRQRRHHNQQSPQFRVRYPWRAGIEATNSELKRSHGLAKVRVRGAPAVALAFYLKCTACNIKRMINYFTRQRKMAPAMC